MITIDKEKLESAINAGISYGDLGRKYGCSISYIKKYALKQGIKLPIRGSSKIPHNKGLKHVYICKNCNKEFESPKGLHRQFCSLKCSAEYRVKEKYKYYLEHQDEFINKEISYEWLKPIIIEEQNDKCAICGIEQIWNGKELHFILDHIDGDATNNRRNNLRCICPNCDSQLPTYKSRNKGHSTRKYKPYHI